MRIPAVLVAIVVLLTACSGDGASNDALRAGRTIYGDNCAVCHDATGRGGVGPALDDVLETFPSCDTQVRWISLGSLGWQEEVGPTYGAQDTPIGGAMPRFENRLEPDEIRSVAAFVRTRYADADPDETLADCGLAE
ncbi:MAG: c-type cytochrome [Acidimicrobiia bacterium]|nr:c-type cytochrome [Acidimicrobiia bacterium]